MKRKVMTVLCGLPRSGKTTWVNYTRTDEVIVSGDHLRKLVYGQRFWEQGEPLMWSIQDIVLRMLMEQGIDVIIDETNTTVKRRQPLLKLASEYGYEAIAVVITTPKDICIERARSENYEALVPVIERMVNQWEPPTTDEGFAEINVWGPMDMEPASRGQKEGEG